MQDHRRLEVYQLARKLALQVCAAALALPVCERYDLCRQLRRAVISVGSNIAEGCGRATRRDFCSYLDNAPAAATEIEFQLDHCRSAELGPIEPATEALETTKRVQQMLTRLIVRIRRADDGPPHS